MILIIFVLISTIANAETLFPSYSLEYLDSMAIEIAPGENRPYIFSGYDDPWFYGTTDDTAYDGFMGYYIGETRLWKDFQIVIDSLTLKRSEAKISFLPYSIVFRWEDQKQLTIFPLFADKTYLLFRFEGFSDTVEFKLDFAQSANMGLLRNLISFRQKGVSRDTVLYGLSFNFGEMLSFDKGIKSLTIEVPPLKHADILLLHSANLSQLKEVSSIIINSPNIGIEERKRWCLNEINRSYFRCNIDSINLALNWMKISLASLWFDKGTKLWAGLPWFNDCWGRDTFISLPGACLVQGDYEKARKIIEQFADWQCKDTASSNYGRIPNRVRSGEVIYNTADGTPLFVKDIHDYGIYSGDYDLWRKMIDDSVLSRAYEGTIKYHTDSLGLLTHGDAETWMDAVGPEGPWTPRGNRAVEVQTLWLRQIKETSRIFYQMAPGYKKWGKHSVSQCLQEHYNEVRVNFENLFQRHDGEGYYDHLNSDGTPDTQIRPNELLAYYYKYDYFGILRRFDKVAGTVKTANQYLAYPYGIVSLAQTDSNFHPYHQYYLYPKDAAYHNGTVWTWLSGAYKFLNRGGWTVAKTEMWIALHQGVPGTLPELLNAVPEEGKSIPGNSGTVSQAWSLAEFLKILYQDYIGIRPNFNEDADNGWRLNPAIPSDITALEAVLNLQKMKVLMTFEAYSDSVVFTFQSDKTYPHHIKIDMFYHYASWESAPFSEPQVQRFVFSRQGNNVILRNNVEEDSLYELFIPVESDSDYLRPEIAPYLKSMRLPPYNLLSGAQIATKNPPAKTIYDFSDAEFDDIGDGDYIYPTDPNFQAGILDLTYFQLRADSANYYFILNFRNLVQPGWHPEYGFQLTLAAIAIHSDVKMAKTTKTVGCNSGWTLADDYKADRFIYIGGGVAVEDAIGRKLCEYIPREMGYPLGDIDKKEIAFALPKQYLPGNPEDWKITVLVGAQDDHGGAGLGEFRSVEAKAGRWVGGGGGEGMANVFDSLQIP
jgi:glycogen debranching enzyme